MLINRINQRLSSVAAFRRHIKLKPAATQVRDIFYPIQPNSNPRMTLMGVVMLAQAFLLPLSTQLQKTSEKISYPPIFTEQLRNLRPVKKFTGKNSQTTNQNFNNIFGMVQKIVPEVSKEFINSIITTAKKVNCSAEDLTAIMYVESKFKPDIKNGSFVGLGQMNPKSLKLSQKYARENPAERDGINNSLTHSQFQKLTREQQIPYVKNYILAMKEAYVKNPDKKMSGGELYALFYTPGRVNSKFLAAKNDSATSKYYTRNLDYNKDGKVTKTDLQQMLDSVKVVSMGMNKNIKH